MHVDGTWFKDDEGRTLLLRGVNLGGSTKVPYRPDGATYRREGFFDHRNVSFVGRPFLLAEADEHLGRLRAWGMTFLRFLITWEAIVRPYARKVAGQPLRMHFRSVRDLPTRTFEFEFRHDPAVRAPTEIFVPNYQYPRGYTVEVSDGSYEVNQASQTLVYRHGSGQDVHQVRVRSIS